MKRELVLATANKDKAIEIYEILAKDEAGTGFSDS